METESETGTVFCPECGREVWSGCALCICGAAFPGPRGEQ